MTRAEKAKNNFLNGLNCTQAILLAFQDEIGLDEATLKAIGLPLGGGMGRLRQTCGTVSGAAVCVGLLFPELSKAETYAIVQEIAFRFEKKNGSINCGVLLSGAGIAPDTSPAPEARTPKYYKKRPCPDLAYDAAEILEEICKERGRI